MPAIGAIQPKKMLMSKIARFTYYVNSYSMDLSFALESPDNPEYEQAIQLCQLLKLQAKSRSQKKQLELQGQILELLNFELDVEYDPGQLFEGTGLAVPLSLSTTTIDLSLEHGDLEYQFSGDIWFELLAKKNLTEKRMQQWEETSGGIQLPAFRGGIGEYAGDSGSQIGWEIVSD